jgi:hypothetical protein
VTGWLTVWTRAVVTPAWRRAVAVWIGTAMGGGIVFGPTGMHPRDLTELAVGVPAVGAALAITWLLVFVPTARVLVRAEGARFLRSLPGPRWPPRIIAAVALLVLQLPWLALWIAGDGLRGLAIVLGLSLVIALLATWQPRPRAARFPPWTRPYPALRGVYVRALKRRAGDALVRGVGLALLAGLAAALIVRNNALVGSNAATLGSGAIAIVLIPGWAGALLPLVDAQRASAWLASSLGMSPLLRVGVLVTVVVGVYIAGTLVALAAVAVGFATLFEHSASATASTVAWLSGVALACAIGMGLVTSRALVIADRELAQADRSLASPVREVAGAPVRVVTGSVVASALAVLCLG